MPDVYSPCISLSNEISVYVYSLPWTDDDIKDLIWEYLNDWSPTVLSELAKKYRKQKIKNDKRQEKYDREKMQNNVETR